MVSPPLFFSLRSLFVSLLFLLVVSPARAQAPAAADSGNFVEATVVTTEGDSIRGRVKWASEAPTPTTLHFRNGDSDSPRTYSPSTLQSVRLNDGRRLVSRSVLVDQVPTDPHDAARFLQSGRDRQERDTLFLEVIVTGPLAMYAKRGARNHYYVETEGETTELLKRRQYVAAQNAVATRRRYRKQLRARMEACPKAQAATDHLSFQLQPIKALIARHNRCVGDTDIFERADRPRFSTSVGVVGGAMRSEFAISSRFTGFNSFGWGTGAQLGASLTTRLLRTNRHWAVHAELVGLLQRIDANAGRSGYFLGVSTLSESDVVEMTWAKSSVLMRYYTGSADWRPYAEAGVTFGYLLTISSTLDSLSPYVLDQNRFTPGVAAGTGLQYRNVHVGVRAELTSAWASYSNIKSRLVNVSLSMGYQF